MSASASISESDLRELIIQLGPWHQKVQVTESVSTAVSLEAPKALYSAHGPVAFIDDHDEFAGLMGALFPDGLAGKTLIEAACNCGAYSLWFRQMGGRGAFGFDARNHWIRQAEFLKSHLLSADDDSVQFAVADLYAVPSLNREPADVGMFKGIFYHLPDPIGGLRIVADLTRELLIFNTSTRSSFKPGLVLSQESVTNVMSGIHGLNWFPSGPNVAQAILKSMGFNDFRVLFWHKRPSLRFGSARGLKIYVKNMIMGTGRMELLAARTPGFFDAFDSSGFHRAYRWT
ncbi:MAG: hypothetical protein KDA89_18925 [Planctomycetaceae bacterium]|nr:hypothetical protein [Planctomycetaceae bacterium]